jgi:hypothetical protein
MAVPGPIFMEAGRGEARVTIMRAEASMGRNRHDDDNSTRGYMY